MRVLNSRNRIYLSFFVLLMISRFSFAQQSNISSQEIISILKVGQQTASVIEKNETSLTQLELLNKLKKRGLSDELIIEVFSISCKLTEEDIQNLLSYQESKLKISTISKVLSEKEKFTFAKKNSEGQISVQPVKEKSIKFIEISGGWQFVPKDKTNLEIAQKLNISIDPKNGHLYFQGEVRFPSNCNFFSKSSESIKKWESENFTKVKNKTENELLGYKQYNLCVTNNLDFRFIPSTGFWTKNTRIVYNVTLKVYQDKVEFSFYDFIHKFDNNGIEEENELGNLKTVNVMDSYKEVQALIHKIINKIN